MATTYSLTQVPVLRIREFYMVPRALARDATFQPTKENFSMPSLQPKRFACLDKSRPKIKNFHRDKAATLLRNPRLDIQ
jgi:hypothetical protein